MIELLDGLYSGDATPENTGDVVDKKKYGVTIDAMLGDVDSNGQLKLPTTGQSVVLTGVKSVAQSALRYKFYNSSIISFSAPDLETLSTGNCCEACCYTAAVETISLPKLASVTGYRSMYWMFRGCPIEKAEFPSLTTLTGNLCMEAMFYGCTSLTEVKFPALSDVSGQTSQFKNMLQGCTDVTVHFPAAMETTMQAWDDVVAGFGGTNTTVLFDL